MNRLILTLSATALFFATSLSQNAAELDLSFDPENNANSVVESITLQPDGKIIVTGHFSSKIVRLNSDGSKDLSFNQPADWGAVLKDSDLLSDGKIIVVGNFTDFDGTSVNHIVRLNTDGTVDNSFNQGTGANNYINCVKVQDDGKILIGGVFTEYNGTPRGGVARLNTDGSLDNSFQTGTGLSGISSEAESIDIQSDGKILFAGKFTSYDGNPSEQSVRLNSDGSFDASYSSPVLGGGSAADRRIADIKVQSDGKIIIGGHFETVAGTTRKCIARLNSDGTVDTSFDPGDGAQLTWGTLVVSTFVLPDGKILIGGKFNTFDGESRRCIARVNADGSHDTAFDPGEGVTDFLPYALVSNFVLQPDGKILIGGDFDEYNQTTRLNIARLNGDGSTSSVLNHENNFIFNIYPNPTNQYIKIENIPSHSVIKITDLNGKVLLEQFTTNNIELINTSKFVDGMYFVTLENQGKISTKKLAVKK